MKISLVFLPEHRIVNEPTMKETISNFGTMPSLSLLYAASVCEQLGHEVQFLDVTAMGLSQDDVVSRLKKFEPDLIGLTMYTSHFHWAKEWIAHIKEVLPNVKAMVGGVHCSMFYMQTAEYIPCVDFIIVGEAESVLPSFLGKLDAGESLSDVKGVVYREDGEVRFHGPAPVCEDLDTVPFPARHLIPNEVYFNFISRRRNFTIFNTSRNCPFRCIFCEAGGKKWRARSAKNVVDEMEQCLTDFNIHEIDIFDSSFTVNKGRVLEICDEIRRRGLQKEIVWVARSRVDTINEEMLVAMKAAGCYRIFYGIESGVPEILKKLRKTTDVERMEETIRLTDKIGISTFGYFLIGAPGENRETARRTLDFAKKLPLDFMILNRLTAYPGTELYEKYYIGAGKSDFWTEYMASPEPPDYYLGRPWTELSDEEVSKLTMKYMLEFYLRPKQVYRAIQNVRSFGQMRRYVKAGCQMFGGYLKNFVMQ